LDGLRVGICWKRSVAWPCLNSSCLTPPKAEASIDASLRGEWQILDAPGACNPHVAWASLGLVFGNRRRAAATKSFLKLTAQHREFRFWAALTSTDPNYESIFGIGAAIQYLLSFLNTDEAIAEFSDHGTFS
jgi:hypothetical protein